MIDAMRPLLAITMGDPAGIGPEIVLKALAHADVFERCRPLVIGDRRIMERAAGWLGRSDRAGDAAASRGCYSDRPRCLPGPRYRPAPDSCCRAQPACQRGWDLR